MKLIPMPKKGESKEDFRKRLISHTNYYRGNKVPLPNKK